MPFWRGKICPRTESLDLSGDRGLVLYSVIYWGLTMKTRSLNAKFVSRTLAIVALLLGVSDQAAFSAPDDRVSFREFRQQYEGVDRNALRRQFHQQFGKPTVNAKPLPTTVTPVPNFNALERSQNVFTNISRNAKEAREPKIKNQSIQELASGLTTRVNRGIDLDLSSANRNIVLGKSLFDNNTVVEISVGGKSATYTAGSVVTAAEYVAVKQALSGAQQVEVDRAGRAIGGSVTSDR